MNIEIQTALTPDIGDDRDPGRPVLTHAMDHAEPHHIATHSHYRAQLLYAIRGVMTVESAVGSWVVPPQQAVWLPAGLEHAVSSGGRLAMRSLYIHPQRTGALPADCCVVNVPDLLRALILALSRLDGQERASPRGRRMVALLLDELAALSPAPLHLPLPSDGRVRSVAETLLDDPADPRGLAQLAATAGASERTLARRFRVETGMSFGAWRRQVRLMAAISRLDAGESVSAVAYGLGYQSPSAFVAMFRRVLGAPPARYLRGNAGTEGAGAARTQQRVRRGPGAGSVPQ